MRTLYWALLGTEVFNESARLQFLSHGIVGTDRVRIRMVKVRWIWDRFVSADREAEINNVSLLPLGVLTP